MRSRLVIVAAASLLTASSVPSSATTINPGYQGPVDVGSYGGTLVATTGVQNVTALTFTGSYTENVYADPNNPLCSGCLDFVINVTNTSPSGTTPAEIIARQSTSAFNGFSVDAFYAPLSSGTGRAPEAVNWDDAGGGVIAFSFEGTPLAAGQTTDYLILDTNATQSTAGVMSLQDGSAISGPALQPTAVTPEPGSFLLLGTGLFGMAGIVRRRIA